MTLLRPHLWLLLCLSACSSLVSPEQGPLKCKVERDGGIDPCPRGTGCVNGECVTCKSGNDEICEDGIDNDCDDRVDEHNANIRDDDCDGVDDDCDGMKDEDALSQTEFCDGRDNNCNGEVDEGHDEDGDGVTRCGPMGDFRAGTVDCEDNNAKARPGLDEVCDGLDNDCDDNTDEETAEKPLCPAGQLCRGTCIARSCAVPNSDVVCAENERCVNAVCVKMNCGVACKSDQFCDPATNTCVDVPRQRGNGESCTLNAECASGVCMDAIAFGLSTEALRVCGKACCADGECGMGETCFASGTGARSCLPTSMAINTTTATSGVPSKLCAASSDCPSATPLCAAESTYYRTKRIVTGACRAAPSLREQGFVEQCSAPYLSSSCATHLCLPLIFTDVCTGPCKSSADCTKMREYNANLWGYCQYVDLNQYNGGLPAGNFASVCLATLDQPSATTPAGCYSNSDCPDRTCIGASTNPRKAGQCAPVCCSNAQCMTSARPNMRCVPVARGTGRFEMRCIDQPVQ